MLQAFLDCLYCSHRNQHRLLITLTSLMRPWFKVVVAAQIVLHRSRHTGRDFGETQIFKIFNILKIVKKKYDKKLAKIIKIRLDSR